MSLSLFLKKEKKNWKFSLFFSFLTNELMDMEAAAVFVKNLLESTGYFLFLEKKSCVPHFIFCIISSHLVISLMQFP